METSAPPKAGYRHAATAARQTRELAFDRLPPAVRDRLASGIAHGAPEPLLAARSGLAPLALRALWVIEVLALVGIVVLAGLHFGNIDRRFALQPISFAIAYGALAAAALITAAALRRVRAFQRGAPFGSGRYLFSLDLVEADGGHLRVTSLDTLRRVEPRAREVGIVFDDGHTVAFPIAKKDEPAAVAARVDKAITIARALVYPADEVKLQHRDPFFEVRITDDWEAAAAPPRPSRARFALVALGALITAAPLGLGMLRARNALSDDIMFEEARTWRPGDVLSHKLDAYVSKGVRHKEEAARLLVEQAQGDRETLRRYLMQGGTIGAVADDALFETSKGDPDRLVRYLRAGGGHAAEADDLLFAVARRLDTYGAYHDYLAVGSRHADEVKTTLLPEADFAQAMRSDLVGSLFMFRRRNPGSKHEAEVERRIADLYADTIATFRRREPLGAGRAPFAEALLAYGREHVDPLVTLSIDIGDSTALLDADATLGARHGKLYLPAGPRFSDRALSGMYREIEVALRGWFGGAFRHGIPELTTAFTYVGHPRVEVRCSFAADGVDHWRRPGAVETEMITPHVVVVADVAVVIPQGPKEEAVRWRVRVADTKSGKVRLDNEGGGARSQQQMAEDAFADLVAEAPGRIAESFDGKL